MATIKSYTDIEQSRKLAKFLPIESADMYYDRGGLPSLIDKYVTHESITLLESCSIIKINTKF